MGDWNHRNRTIPIKARVVVPGLEAWKELSPERQALLEQWIPAVFMHAGKYEDRFELERGELVTTAFGIACRAARAWKPGRSAFSTYLFASLKRSLLQWCSRHRYSERARKQSAIPEYSHPTVRDPAPAFDERTIEVVLDRAGATPRQRLLARMRMQGATLAQCGAAFGTTQEAARKCLEKLARKVSRAA